MSKPIIKMALMMLDNIRQQLIDGQCDEEDIQDAMTKFHPENNGYFKQEDFITADKAMKILHLGTNRVKFFELTKEYGIENKKISNQNIGFLKKDIERLASILSDEIKEREKKERKKKGQRKFLW
jgi:hypothetical protein